MLFHPKHNAFIGLSTMLNANEGTCALDFQSKLSTACCRRISNYSRYLKCLKQYYFLYRYVCKQIAISFLVPLAMIMRIKSLYERVDMKSATLPNLDLPSMCRDLGERLCSSAYLSAELCLFCQAGLQEGKDL